MQTLPKDSIVVAAEKDAVARHTVHTGHTEGTHVPHMAFAVTMIRLHQERMSPPTRMLESSWRDTQNPNVPICTRLQSDDGPSCTL